MMRHNRQNRRKFLYYSAYAWLFPLVWVLFTLYAEQKRPLPDKWNPSFADTTCFFAGLFISRYLCFLSIAIKMQLIYSIFQIMWIGGTISCSFYCRLEFMFSLTASYLSSPPSIVVGSRVIFIGCNAFQMNRIRQQNAKNSLYQGQCWCKCPNCSFAFLGHNFSY